MPNIRKHIYLKITTSVLRYGAEAYTNKGTDADNDEIFREGKPRTK
jgi:hypothetical protein